MHEFKYVTNHQLEKDEDHETPWLQNLKAYKRNSFLKRKMN